MTSRLRRSMSAAAEPPVAPTTDPLEAKEGFQQATETIRSTAKWLATAFAGVGAVLIAGISLTGLGKLHATQLTIASIAVLGALLAIVYIIPRVARVFTAKYITLASLATQTFPGSTSRLVQYRRLKRMRPIIESVKESSEELYGGQAADLADLYRRMGALNQQLREVPFSVRNTIVAERAALGAAADRVIAFANYEDARQSFRQLYKPMAGAAAVVALGASVFAYAVGSVPSDANVTTPTAVRLNLNPSASNWAQLLGPQCDVSKVDAVAIAGDFAEPEVITSGTGGCNVVQLRVTQKRGEAVPLVAVPKASASASSSP
jgi:hypothetical protein